jgi:UDP-N-acetylmuramyl pentapeptide synthase
LRKIYDRICRKTLQDLFGALPARTKSAGEIPALQVTGVTYNHRELQAGNIFVANRGMKVDGHDFIDWRSNAGGGEWSGREKSAAGRPHIRVRDSERRWRILRWIL